MKLSTVKSGWGLLSPFTIYFKGVQVVLQAGEQIVVSDDAKYLTVFEERKEILSVTRYDNTAVIESEEFQLDIPQDIAQELIEAYITRHEELRVVRNTH